MDNLLLDMDLYKHMTDILYRERSGNCRLAYSHDYMDAPAMKNSNGW